MKDIYDEGVFKVDARENPDNFGEEDAFEVRPRKLVSYAWPKRESIKEQLEEAYYNRDQLDDMGAKGREFAKQYDWNKIVPQWVDVLKDIEDETSYSGDMMDDSDLEEVMDMGE
jgi:glycosyltransferase involved in cell wall biosynthesis